MKKILILAIAIVGFVTSSCAFGDGFVCQARNGSLTVKAYDHTDASVGTRTGAVMVLSDPDAREGERTIARFRDASGTLSSSTSIFKAKVDLRFSDQKNKEALVAQKYELRELSAIVLAIDFSYNEPVPAGESVDGVITLHARDGDALHLDATCERYLKQ